MIKRIIRIVVSMSVLISILTGPGFVSTAHAADCSFSDAGVAITALHRLSSDAWTTKRPFYADTGAPALDSGYIGYAIDGALANPTAVPNLWMKISNFTSTNLKLGKATTQSDAIPVTAKFKNNDGSDNATKRIAYFYLTSSATTTITAAQNFTIQLYNGNPNLTGTEICSFSDGFSGIEDVIAASANKITSISATTNTPSLGSTFSITARGESGQMGAGIDSDQVVDGRNKYGVFSLAPSMSNTWPADAFTFSGLTFTYDENDNGSLTGETPKYNFLRYYPLTSPNKIYSVTYNFTARQVVTAEAIRPVQNIASGTQVKYTGAYPGTPTTVTISKANLSLTKAIVSVVKTSTDPATPSVFELTYRLSLINASSTTSYFDYINDAVTLNGSGEGGGLFTDLASGFKTEVLNTGDLKPTDISVSTSLNNTGPVLTSKFVGTAGLMSIPANSTKTLEYKIKVTYPLVNAAMPINNTATGYIGSETVTATGGINAVSTDLKQTVTLTLKKSADGYLTSNVKQSDGTSNCSIALNAGEDVICTFYKGTTVVITPNADTGKSFSAWGDDCDRITTSTCTLTINVIATVSATYSAGANYTLTATVGGNGKVSQASTGGSLKSGSITDCTSAICSATYASGTEVTLTATPDTGYKVVQWTGDCSGTATSCVLTMSAAKSVGITFEIITYTITLGTITRDPSDTTSTVTIADSPAQSDDTITLTIVPASGMRCLSDTLYARYGGSTATLSGTGPYTFTMPSANVTIDIRCEKIPSSGGGGRYIPPTTPEPTPTPPAAPPANNNNPGRFTPTGPGNTNIVLTPPPAGGTTQVLINGRTACTTTTGSCGVPALLGPKAKIEAVTTLPDGTKSTIILPAYAPEKPIPALVVYFPLASAKLTKAEVKKLDEFVKLMKEQGFTRVELTGHTDVQGTSTGFDNRKLSNNRSKVVANYLSKFLKVSIAKDSFADTQPAVDGSGEAVYKNNRRTEVSVW